MEQRTEIIKNIIETILARLNVKGGVEFMETSEGARFLVKTNEGALLIGENGQNILALNHLVKKIAEKTFAEEDKDIKEKLTFSLDVNDYQAKRIDDLKNLARLNAQRVRFFKKEIMLKPMTSFERRVIHSVLTEYPDISTESVGEEPHRKVVIKPYQ
ncbi:MAG: hypothetical protein A3A10_01295 [Candidatus Tagabacteria bacterium RIFCSPLOWO2_01_FULL_42_9]|uniref:R3H domain-containing protein n=1 Tax=Candidatus Tagabacteria bacterium RIFCSPLOWO2_01_FULL_42_9 TaxID=1802296 RepID=A0A1G2LW08_9BACT|nr:MAG: hypothetical protein A3A10_01295 [Candidatus Tagabacteria bacterium RIFCSPLOWO2_01_FULL_42_9]